MKRFILSSLFCFLMFTNPSPAASEFTLSLTVPLYGQDTSYYCGAASGQMMMMGYPVGATNVCHGQENIYNRIQAHKQDNGFYTDPDGLRDAVMELNAPPSPGRYSIFHNANRSTVLHDVLYWMAQRQYPTATLINGGAHWVVITGYQTDIDPRQGSATLQTIDIHDPLPQDYAPHDDPCTAADEGNEGGTIRNVTGSSWFSNDWNNPNAFGTKWLNEYVAIVEPPEVSGQITVKETEPSEGTVVPPEKAIQLALKHARERGLLKKKSFQFLNDTSPKRALLTNRKHKGYYVIPFEFKESRRSPGAILLNAYTGEFQEIGAFPRPLEYLSDKEAITIALCSARKKTVKRSAAELIFQLSEQVRSRYRPIWKVTLWDREGMSVRYVDHIGQVYTELTPILYGGD